MDYKTYLDYKKIYLLLYGQQHYTSWHINGTENSISEFDSSAEFNPFITADLSSFTPINIEYSATADLDAFITVDLCSADPIYIVTDINSTTLEASLTKELEADGVTIYTNINTNINSSQSADLVTDDPGIDYSSYLDSAKIYVEAWFYVAYYDHGQVISDVSDMTIKRFTYDRI